MVYLLPLGIVAHFLRMVSWNLNTMLRRWLDTPIISWEYDWMPRALKLTTISHLKTDGWKMISSPSSKSLPQYHNLAKFPNEVIQSDLLIPDRCRSPATFEKVTQPSPKKVTIANRIAIGSFAFFAVVRSTPSPWICWKFSPFMEKVS